MFSPSRIAKVALLSMIAPLVLAPTPRAAAQHVDGCFLHGQQVADSMCNPGSGGGGSPRSGAAMSAAGSLGFAIGGALGDRKSTRLNSSH